MPDTRLDGGESDGPDRYDFDRLERSVRFLLEEHQRLSAERAELLDELVEREKRVKALEAQLESERTLRTRAIDRVDKVLARVERLQSSVAAAAESA